jgi:polyisoprenoid-binding protein YceI
MIATLPDIRSQRGLRPGRWLVDDAHSAVLFSIRHLGLSRVRGRFDRFEATLDVGPSLAETRVEATIDLASIDTNNVDRDAHLRSSDFFAVDATRRCASSRPRSRGRVAAGGSSATWR